MRKLGSVLCLAGLAACQTTQPSTALADCAHAQTQDLIKACQDKHVEELQNLRQDIRKNRPIRS